MGLEALNDEIVSCEQCPRLRRWCSKVAEEKRAAYRNEDYWGAPVGGFGDPGAQIAVIGLAPAAHGANRTGRMFTGDRSGDWLYRAIHRAGLSNQPTSVGKDDGLVLQNVWVTNAVKCAPPANKPTATEQNRCRPFLQRELDLLTNLRVIISLGGIGTRAVVRHFDVTPRPKFGHGVEVRLTDELTLVTSYHVSQQNTFTGRLTEKMLDDVFSRSVTLATGR